MGSLAWVRQPLSWLREWSKGSSREPFHSQHAMASGSQPCPCLWKSVAVLSGRWCLQVCLGLLWLHWRQETTKVCNFHTIKIGTEHTFTEKIFCLGAHRWFWERLKSQQITNASLKASLVASYMWKFLGTFTSIWIITLMGERQESPLASDLHHLLYKMVLRGTQSLHHSHVLGFSTGTSCYRWDVLPVRQPAACWAMWWAQPYFTPLTLCLFSYLSLNCCLKVNRTEISRDIGWLKTMMSGYARDTAYIPRMTCIWTQEK